MNFFAKLFLGFQEPATPIMEGIVDFHNYIFFFLVLILVFVFFMAFVTLVYFWYSFERPASGWDVLFRETSFRNHRINHGTTLEIIWTLIPIVILMTIAFPSFSLLYSMDEVMMPAVTLKVVGHQWYWSYEYGDSEQDPELLVQELVESVPPLPSTLEDEFSFMSEEDIVEALIRSLQEEKFWDVEFDSYMVPESDLRLGDRRMLEVTESVVLPINTYVRVLVTSADVLHSFSVNSLGVKVDAVPGRLNQVSVYLKRQGVFYGQCSEICGVSHGMMPIVVRGVGLENYVDWLASLSAAKVQ